MYDSQDVVVNNNNFTGNNNNGVYLSTTDFDNVTANNFQSQGNNGIYATSSGDLYIRGNMINDSGDSGVYFDTVTDSQIIGNEIPNSGTNGVYVTSSSTIDVDTNILDGSYYGLYCTGSPSVTIVDNQLSSNYYGIYASNCDFGTIDPNDIYGNYYGVYLNGVDYTTLEANTIHDNTANGVYVNGGSYVDMVDNQVYDNCLDYYACGYYGYYGSVYYSSTTDSLLDGNRIYNTGGYSYTSGVQFSSTARMTINDEIYNHFYGVFVYPGVATDTLVNNSDIYNNVYGVYASSNANTWIANSRIYQNGFPGYGSGVYFAAETNPDINDTEIYNNGMGVYFGVFSTGAEMYDVVIRDNPAGAYGLNVVGGSDVYADNLAIYGMEDSYLAVDVGDLLVADNFWLGYDDEFGIAYNTITITGTDTDAGDWNMLIERSFISMNSTDTDVAELSVPANLTIRPKDGCSDIRYYNDSADLPSSRDEIIADGDTFTPAYSACNNNIATFEVPSFTGYAARGQEAAGLGEMSITVTGDKIVGEELVITVKDGATPLSNANVKVSYWVSGTLNVIGLGNTNSSGQVSFTPSVAGSHKAAATKSGYFDEDVMFTVGSGAPPQNITMLPQQQPSAPECTVDADCLGGEVCQNSNCVAPPPPPEEQPPAEQPSAPECTVDADCASGFVCQGGACVTAPPPEEQPPAAPEEVEVPGEGQPEEQPPQGGLPWWALGGIIVLGGAGIWWFLLRKP
ncbi:MAG: right-handed parallel beta-helix repeat-containing protein [Candidatus Micrarchaeota archaeon]